jgi:hypothetical protein
VTEAELLRAQEELLGKPRLHDVLARDNGVFAVFASIVGFDGHSPHVGGAYVVGPDGSTVTESEIGPGDRWRAVELGPALPQHARENPWFALEKRRHEAYDEPVAHQ